MKAVNERPYVLLSCSMSIDGYLDAATEKRLLLSNDDDFDRVDAVRAAVRRDPRRARAPCGATTHACWYGRRPDATSGWPAA